MRPARWLLAVVAVLAAAGCTSAEPAGLAPSGGLGSSVPLTVPTTTVPTTTVPTARPDPAPTTTVPAVFRAEVVVIDAAIAPRLSRSWRPGCPVGLDELRLLRLRHWGLDGAVHEGELVVHRDVADDVVRAFGRIFDARFPIARVRLVDEYGADDQASMRDDNTSAFNCREVAGRPGVWSEHAYGRAIDINPLRNPWVRGAVIDPPEGARWADRTLREPGMLDATSAPVLAFAEIGWGWGGNWTGGQDWQHVSASGR